MRIERKMNEKGKYSNLKQNIDDLFGDWLRVERKRKKEKRGESKMAKEFKIVCPNCGSDQIVANKKGWDPKKAVTGGLLFGIGGALIGGMGSSNDITITCLACGKKFKPGKGKKVWKKK